jgi:hypothetical protein
MVTRMKFGDTYTLPAHWAPAIINHDWSGLSADDEEALTDFLDAAFPDGFCSVSVEDSIEQFDRYHDAIRYTLPCDCITYVFVY